MGEPSSKKGTSAWVIDGNQVLSEKTLLAGIRKGLGLAHRRRFRAWQVQEAILSKSEVHHPIWLAKIVTYADRPPFRPKSTPNVVFVDAVSGYRGVLEMIPTLNEIVHVDAERPAPVIDTPERAHPYVRAVLSTVDRRYALKKPRHEVKELTLVNLPLWRVRLDLEGGKEIILNANTGEPEKYLSSQWERRAWLDMESR